MPESSSSNWWVKGSSSTVTLPRRPGRCSPRCSAGDSSARRQLVELISRWGTDEDADELLRLAFTKPVDVTTLAKVSNFVRRDRRVSPALSSSTAVRFVADFAVRLKTVKHQVRRSTAVRWRGAITELLQGMSPEDQLRLLDFLSEMEEQFASNVVLQLEPWRYPDVLARLAVIVNWPGLPAQLRRNIRLVLSRTARTRGLAAPWWHG